MNDPRTASPATTEERSKTEARPTERSGATPITITDSHERDTVTFSEKDVTVVVGEEQTLVVTETNTVEIEVISNEGCE